MIKFSPYEKHFAFFAIIFSLFFLYAPVSFAKPGDNCTSDAQCTDTQGSLCESIGNSKVCTQAGYACTSNTNCTPPAICNTTTKRCEAGLSCPSGQKYDNQQKKCVVFQTSNAPTGVCCIGQKSQQSVGSISDFFGCQDVSPNTDCSTLNNTTVGVTYTKQNKSCKEIGGCPQATADARMNTYVPAPKFTPINPKLQIPIPTIQFSTAVLKDGSISIPFLAEYIAGLYKYGVSIVSIVAIVMIMVGGLKWLTAGGSADRVKSAINTISGAVVGLMLLLGSYILLYYVNPDLTKLKPLGIQYVEGVAIDLIANENTVPPGENPNYSASPSGNGFNGVPAYRQSQDPWGKTPYGNCTATYASAGCGATSLAMVLKFYNINTDPKIVGDFAVQAGYRVCGRGTASGLMVNVDKNNAWSNMKGEYVNGAKAIELLKEKKPIILGTPAVNDCYKKSGHYIVATGVDDQGRVRINDPALCGKKFGGYNGEDGVWAAKNGDGVTALTQAKFLQGGGYYYVHPK